MWSSCHGCARIAAWLKYFEIVFTCCDTDHHERGSCFPAFVFTTRLLSAHPLRCVCWVLVCSPGSRTLLLDQLLCTASAQTRHSNRCCWTNRGVTTFQRPALSGPSCSVCLCSRSVLGALVQQRCSSRVASLLGACGISNLVKVLPEPRCTRPLRVRSSGFLAHVPSQARNVRRNHWRGIRRSRPGQFLPLGVSIRNFQCASCRPGSLPCCPCRTPHHRFWSTCFSCRISRRNGGTTGSWHRETLRHARVDCSQRSVLRGRLHGVTRRAVVQRDECAGIARECSGVPRRRTYAVRTGLALASNGGRAIRQSRRPRVPQSGPGRRANCNIGGTSTQFPYAEGTGKGVTHSCETRPGSRQPRQSETAPFQPFSDKTTFAACSPL